MSKSGTTASFKYNENGLRIQKTVNSVVTNYTLHGKNIMHMTQGSNALHFFYDASNKPAIVDFNGTKYAYVHNLQGDIVAILDSAGTVVVQYMYDAWGRIISKMGSLASTLGTVQPFRYRGYVYDEETGLYYLRSRFYCSNRCRFLNADTILHGEGMPITAHLFSYCDNSPVITVDEDGQVWVMGVYAAYYGYFHVLTQSLVAARNPGMGVEVSLHYKGWRADLIYNGAIYEVKPKRDIHIIIGTAQVARYVSNTSYTAGVAPLLLPEPRTWQVGNRTITMNFEQQGSLILYSFEIKKTQEQEQEQTAPATNPVTVPAESPAESRKRTKPNLPVLDPVCASNIAGALAMTVFLGGGALVLAYCFSDSSRLNMAR